MFFTPQFRSRGVRRRQEPKPHPAFIQEVRVSLLCSSIRSSLTSSIGQNDSSFIAETSFVRAPLNSRVVSSNVPKSKGKGKQESLDRVPLEIQQALVLEDLLFVLMVWCHISWEMLLLFERVFFRELKGLTLHITLNIRPRKMIRCRASDLLYHLH